MKKKYDILLCDLDAFFASVEQLDCPQLIGKPIIVGGNPEGRGVVATCSYEARKFGVRSAMPVKKALQLCPEALLLPGNMARYKEVSGQVREIFERFTPDIEFVSIDEAYLSVTQGTGYDLGKAIHFVVRKELHLPISVGVSENKLLAKIACELAKPDNVGTLWPDQVPALLWPLPVKVIPGIGPATEKKLHSYGIKTVKDLAEYPEDTLRRLCGKHATSLHHYAHGIDNRKLEIAHDAKSISEEITFPEDTHDRKYIHAALHELSEGVGYRLRSEGLPARTISLKLRFKDFQTITRSKTLPQAIDGDSEIYLVVKTLFDLHCGKPPWRLVGVKASEFEHEEQISLLPLTPEEEKEKELLLTKDKLRKKYGKEVLFSATRLSKK